MEVWAFVGETKTRRLKEALQMSTKIIYMHFRLDIELFFHSFQRIDRYIIIINAHFWIYYNRNIWQTLNTKLMQSKKFRKEEYKQSSITFLNWGWCLERASEDFKNKKYYICNHVASLFNHISTPKKMY